MRNGFSPFWNDILPPVRSEAAAAFESTRRVLAASFGHSPRSARKGQHNRAQPLRRHTLSRADTVALARTADPRKTSFLWTAPWRLRQRRLREPPGGSQGGRLALGVQLRPLRATETPEKTHGPDQERPCDNVVGPFGRAWPARPWPWPSWDASSSKRSTAAVPSSRSPACTTVRSPRGEYPERETFRGHLRGRTGKRRRVYPDVAPRSAVRCAGGSPPVSWISPQP